MLHLPSSGLGHSSPWEEPLEMLIVFKMMEESQLKRSLGSTSMSGLTCALAVPVSIRKTPPSPT